MVSDGQGGSFFADLPEAAEAGARLGEIVRSLASAHLPIARPWAHRTHSPGRQSDLLSRSTHWSGILLASRKLVTLVYTFRLCARLAQVC